MKEDNRPERTGGRTRISNLIMSNGLKERYKNHADFSREVAERHVHAVFLIKSS
jgi:hypothetical protein